MTANNALEKGPVARAFMPDEAPRYFFSTNTCLQSEEPVFSAESAAMTGTGVTLLRFAVSQNELRNGFALRVTGLQREGQDVQVPILQFEFK